MYDVYDSVDDDPFEKYSVDSLENGELSLKSVTSLDKRTMRSSQPFRLHGEGYFTVKPTDLRGQKLFEDGGENPKLAWNCEMDESTLISKGLQLNADGSISKSPREKLPFIMPASKVAEIRWKKKMSGKKNSREQVACTGFNEERGLQNITEHRRIPNEDISRLKTGENLTDSMKQALWKTYKKRRYQTQGNVILNAGKSTSFLPRFEKPSTLRADGKQKSEESSVRKWKVNKSDLKLPLEQKAKLSYYERYQKMKGFDPESISRKVCKPPNDTVRSNFGDLTRRDTLSEISGEFASGEVDDGEESFYEKIITREKFRLGKSAGIIDGEESRKEEANIPKATIKKNLFLKNIRERSPTIRTSSTLFSGKKSHRLCTADSEILPKGELASKARAYGNLANTRNMAKLQLKSLKNDKNGSLVNSSTPPYSLSNPQIENSRQHSELWEWESFLPCLAGKEKKEVEIPWETRNLLMQISTERQLFKQNMNHLKNRLSTKEKICFDENMKCRHTIGMS